MRMVFLKKTVLLYIAVIYGLSGLVLGSNNTPPERPNIIFILTDDQRWDALGCMGNPHLRTPNLDRLAAEGVRFERAFVSSPSCTPSPSVRRSPRRAASRATPASAMHVCPDPWRHMPKTFTPLRGSVALPAMAATRKILG